MLLPAPKPAAMRYTAPRLPSAPGAPITRFWGIDPSRLRILPAAVAAPKRFPASELVMITCASESRISPVRSGPPKRMKTAPAMLALPGAPMIRSRRESPAPTAPWSSQRPAAAFGCVPFQIGSAPPTRLISCALPILGSASISATPTTHANRNLFTIFPLGPTPDGQLRQGVCLRLFSGRKMKRSN